MLFGLLDTKPQTFTIEGPIAGHANNFWTLAKDDTVVRIPEGQFNLKIAGKKVGDELRRLHSVQIGIMFTGFEKADANFLNGLFSKAKANQGKPGWVAFTLAALCVGIAALKATLPNTRENA